MKKILCVLLALSFGLSSLACTSAAPQAAAQPTPLLEGSEAEKERITQLADASSGEGGYAESVYIASEEDLPTADPYAAASSAPAFFTNLTFDTLVYIDVATSEVVGELATAWEDVNGDGSVWDVHLVENATFHNGAPFTAEDVVFTWNYVTNPENVVCALSGSYVTNCKSVEAVGPYTVRFTLEQGMPDFISNLEFKIYSKEAFDTLDAASAAVIGTGPYAYNAALTKSGVQFVATRYDAYWGGIETHPTKNLVFLWMPSTDTAVAALQAGEADVLFALGASQAGVIAADPNCTLLTTEGTGSWYIGFNYNHRELFDDLAMRQAVLMSIDKQAIVEVAFEGYASVSNSFVSPVGIGYSADCASYEFDPEAAKEKLAQTGYQGESLVLAYPTATAGLVAEVIQACLANIGVTVELAAVDTNNWTSYKSGDAYDMFVDAAAYQGALLFNPNRFFYTGGNRNFYGYHSEEFEKLLDNVAAQTTWEDMLAAFKPVQQFINDDIPVAPLVYDTMIYATRNDVKGLRLMNYKNYCDFSTLYVQGRS